MSLQWAQFGQKTWPLTIWWDHKGFFSQLIPCCWWCPAPEGPLSSGVVFTLWSVQFFLIKNFSACTCLSPSCSLQWQWLIWTASKSFCMYRMHRKDSFKPKKTVCGGFGVCFQYKNNEFQKRGRRRRRGESHRTKPGKQREKKKNSLLSE